MADDLQDAVWTWAAAELEPLSGADVRGVGFDAVGSVLGIVAWLLYSNVALGGVMALAMMLNLTVAALAGLFIPLAMERFGRDPAIGSSVFLTFVTDSMGFFIFLGLATVFLL